MESPYSLLRELEESRREEGERVPWGAANGDSPDLYSKRTTGIEIAAYLLLNQTDYYTPEMFSDPVSDELVSMSRSANSRDMSTFFDSDNDLDLNLDSLLEASAQRALVGDNDTHGEQYAVTPSGEFYTFDFNLSGHQLSEVFTGSENIKNPVGSYGGLLGSVRIFVRRLGLEDQLDLEKDINYRLELEDEIANELRDRMQEMAKDIDLNQFVSEVESHPQITYFDDWDANFSIDNIINNVEKIRQGEFENILPPEQDDGNIFERSRGINENVQKRSLDGGRAQLTDVKEFREENSLKLLKEVDEEADASYKEVLKNNISEKTTY